MGLGLYIYICVCDRLDGYHRVMCQLVTCNNTRLLNPMYYNNTYL